MFKINDVFHRNFNIKWNSDNLCKKTVFNSFLLSVLINCYIKICNSQTKDIYLVVKKCLKLTYVYLKLFARLEQT